MSCAKFEIYLPPHERMSGLVLSSFFDFLRLFFAFAMPLSYYSIFFRPAAAADLGARLSPLNQPPAAWRFPFNCEGCRREVSIARSPHVEEINIPGKKSTYTVRSESRQSQCLLHHCPAEPS